MSASLTKMIGVNVPIPLYDKIQRLRKQGVIGWGEVQEWCKETIVEHLTMRQDSGGSHDKKTINKKTINKINDKTADVEAHMGAFVIIEQHGTDFVAARQGEDGKQ